MAKTKKILTTTAAAAAVAIGAMAVTAHADVNTNATSAQAKQSTVSAQDQLNNMQAQHSQAESQMASANAAEMASATTDTNNQVAKLQDQLKANQASQVAEDASKLASGTKAINQKAEEATARENAAYSDAVKSQEAANKEALADAAKNIYTPAQKRQLENTKTSQYKQDQTKLNLAHKTKLNGLKEEHDKQVKTLNRQIQNDEAQAQKSHAQAVAKATQQIDDQINDVTNQVNTSQANVNADQKDVNNAQTANDKAESTLISAKAELNNTNINNNFVPSVTISGNRYGEDFNFDVSKDDLAKVNSDHRPVVFDKYGRVSLPQMRELTIWTANLINKIRQKVGTAMLHVSEESIAAANDAMYQYAQTGKTSFSHNETIYSSIDRKYNLPNFKSSIEGYNSLPSTIKTMGDMKSQLVYVLQDLIRDKDNLMPGYGHRNHLLGLSDDKYGYDWSGESNPYFGIGDTFDGESTHFFVSTDGYNQHNIPLTNESTINLAKLQEAVSTAQSQADFTAKSLGDAKIKLANDQQILAKAQKMLNDLKYNRDTKIAELAGNEVNLSSVKTLKKQLADLESSYAANVKAENDAYNQKKSDLDAQYQKDIDAIKAYPENTDQLKQEQTQKLAQLKKDHEAKLAKIKADAAQQIATLKQQLADSHNDVNQPIVDKINALKAALTAKQDQLNQKLADLKANDAAEYNALRDKLMPKQAVTGTTNGYLTAGGQVVSLSAKSGHTASSEAAALPQTGNNSSLAAVVLGAVSMMFSFGLMKKRDL